LRRPLKKHDPLLAGFAGWRLQRIILLFAHLVILHQV
jgi:hypothetical protein